MADICVNGHDRDKVGVYEWDRLGKEGQVWRQRQCMQCRLDSSRRQTRARISRRQAAAGVVPIIEAVQKGLSDDARLDLLMATETMPKWQQLEIRSQLLEGRR